MSDVVTFSLKKNKEKNYTVLFVKVNVARIDASSEKADALIKEYKKIVTNNPGIVVMFDVRMAESINNKLIWEKVPSLASFDTVARKNIKATVIICNSLLIINLIKLITKVHPFVTPTKFVGNNKDALEFIEKHL